MERAGRLAALCYICGRGRSEKAMPAKLWTPPVSVCSQPHVYPHSLPQAVSSTPVDTPYSWAVRTHLHRSLAWPHKYAHCFIQTLTLRLAHSHAATPLIAHITIDAADWCFVYACGCVAVAVAVAATGCVYAGRMYVCACNLALGGSVTVHVHQPRCVYACMYNGCGCGVVCV